MRQIDTIVIGGGIAGLSLAARCAAHVETIVLEAEEAAGYHASGRSVAFAHFGLGDRLVRALTAASLAQLAAIPPDGRPVNGERHPALHIARAEERALLDDLERSHREFAADFARIGPAEIAALVPMLRTGNGGAAEAIIDEGALKLDTNAMLQGHARDLELNGGEIICRAPVRAIARKSKRWIVDTAGASFSAARLVNAAGAWVDDIARMASARPLGIRPLKRTVIQFAAPGDTDASRWPFTKTVGEGFYLLPEGRSRLLASSMDESPSAACDAMPDEIDIAVAADRVMRATSLDIRRIEHSWAGLRSFAPDNHPVAGYDPEVPGFFWLAGQGGFGFQTSPALSLAATSLLLGMEWPESLSEQGLGADDMSPARFGR